MELATILQQKKSSLVKRWFNTVIESYPADTTQFLRRQKDSIANPVGSNFRDGLEGLLDGLIEKKGPAEMAPCLDRLVRIRALQKFSPSQSLSFILAIKGIVRAAVSSEAEREGYSHEIDEFEVRVDRLMFQAFDMYVACRERLYEIKVNDEKRRMHMLLRRANLICESEGEGVDLPDFREGDSDANHEER